MLLTVALAGWLEASDRAATKDEVAEMKKLVLEALDYGACGFATSTLEQHNGHAGIPMPSRLAFPET